MSVSAIAKGDFFYSKSTNLYVARKTVNMGLHVSRKPLMVDSRVKKAADSAGIFLDWDDEGRINYITFDDAKKLMEALGSRIFTPVEYWKVLKDAKEAKDEDMVKQLTSNQYAEWLNRVYFRDNTYIDDPKVVAPYQYEGERKKATSPEGSPGWFNPEGNINEETGEPISVELNREKFATSWKYWSPVLGLLATSDRTATAPIRGYVTSVGKPSLDLGIPADAKQPKLMVRECRTEPLTPVIDAQILDKAEELIVGKKGKELIEFLKINGHLFAGSNDSLVYKLREKFFDLLGEYSFSHVAAREAGRMLSRSSYERQVTEDFHGYVKNSRHNLEIALNENRDIVFVMGHKNPDTDTVVSSLFEAWRNHLINGDEVTYVPVVQGSRMPDEIAHLLQDLSEDVMLTNDELYQQSKNSGIARWISVDQNREPEVQKYFISIIDHHVVSEVAKNRDITKTLEMIGSSSALVARKMFGMGLDLSKEDAKILYGAALMDTENRVKHKMTQQDILIMDYLKKRSAVANDDEFYQDLMSRLLNTDDAGILFRRDYKEDWGFGFAVAKIKNGFRGEKGNKWGLISNLYNLAEENTRQKNLPVTLMKITDYEDDNETVNRERIYFAFNGDASEKFKKTMKKAVESIIKFEFPEDNIETGEDYGDYIDFWGTGMQLSRKKTAPVLQPIVTAFNRYFYSPSIGRYVKRNFLKYTQEVKNVASGLSTDEEGRINYITFPEAKRLVRRLGVQMLSMGEYWQVLKDAKEINDTQMIDSLQGSNFVEFWDSAIINKRILIDHPEIVGEKVFGNEKEIAVPEGRPGLIHPRDIDLETGLPKKVYPPNNYTDRELWRYWEPDNDLVFPCRSFIFLLDQPSWDGKFHIKDSFPNLGLRPVVREVEEPKVEISWDSSSMVVELFEEGEKKIFRWPKNIADYLDIE